MKSSRHIWGLVLAALVGLGVHAARAEDPAAAFAAANQLYEQGHYTNAAAAYAQLAATGRVNRNLYFNLGNAWFKCGQWGRAIAAYRRAEQLAPRDSDLEANLQLARKRVGNNASVAPSRVQRWLGGLTLNEWTVLTMIAGWLWLGVLAAKQWRPAWRASLRNAGFGLGLATGLLAVLTLLLWRDAQMDRVAVVTVPEIKVQTGPLEESTLAFSVPDGVELRVLDRREDWLQVQDAHRRIGWLKREGVQVL
ncbi:MAG TPA: tetratricopeptide repeat protein [Dongiaceae bacterium]|nr:tetratricopeptide repeat protein [Dongiaceae bacterium]